MKYSQDLEQYFQGFTAPVVSLADIPLPEEPHVGRWREYLKMSRGRDIFATLQEKLPQLSGKVATTLHPPTPRDLYECGIRCGDEKGYPFFHDGF